MSEQISKPLIHCPGNCFYRKVCFRGQPLHYDKSSCYSSDSEIKEVVYYFDGCGRKWLECQYCGKKSQAWQNHGQNPTLRCRYCNKLHKKEGATFAETRKDLI